MSSIRRAHCILIEREDHFNNMPKLSSSPDTSKKAFDGTSPASQYARGTLGVATPTPRHRSLPGSQEGQPAPVPARPSFSKKRLDPSDPSTWTSRHTPSFSEPRPRSVSETVARADVPTIRLQHDGDKPTGASGAGVNLDGAGAAQSGPPSQHESQASPESSSAVLDSPVSRHAVPASQTGSGLGVPADKEAESRRFSNQSQSFSSVTTTDSDRIGRIAQESDAENEDAVQESSGSSDSDSSSSDQDDVDSPVSERGRIRASNRESKSLEPQSPEPTRIVPSEPTIRGTYTTAKEKTSD